MPNRPSWDDYFYGLANLVAERSTCPRAKCGCIVVDPDTHDILATGYNGAPRGLDHCTDVGCKMEDGHCQRAIHAEVNAIAQAARRGISLNRSVAYVIKKNISDSTGTEVCRECQKVLDAANVEVMERALIPTWKDN